MANYNSAYTGAQIDAAIAEVGNKVDKVEGKGLSTEDYTSTEKTKLANIEDGANNYTHPSSHPASIIVQDANNRFVTDTEKATWNAKQNALTAGTDYARLPASEVITGYSKPATAGPLTPTDTINEAFGKLEKSLESVDAVGDIKYTIRTDLGDNWLLCNGDAVSESLYPDLYALLVPLPNGMWTANQQGTTSLYSVAYGNGYWVAVGLNRVLYYKADTPDGSWTANQQGTNNLLSVTYANGYWVTVGPGGTLYYKADTPNGTWTANNQGTTSLQSVAYGNGYWVAVGDSGVLYYKANTPNGTWTANKQGANNLLSVTYANGYWVTVGAIGTLYYKADTPNGTWTANNQGGNLRSVAYGNGYWVTVGTTGTLYYKADTPNGTWIANDQSGVLQSVAYGNGYWVAVGDSGVLYYKADTPDGTWIANQQGTTNLRSVAYGNGYWVAVGDSGVLYYTDRTVPTIALDDTYTYIRAK